MLGEFTPQCGNEFAALLVNGTDSAEMIIVLGDCKQPLTGNVPPLRHIFKERHDVVGALGSSERDNEKGIVRGVILRRHSIPD